MRKRSRVSGCLLVGVLTLLGCGRFSDGLKRDLAESRYDDVIARAQRWLQQHPAPASVEEQAEALTVSQVLASAEVERAWRRGDVEELARLRSEFPVGDNFAPQRRRAFEAEATLRYVDEVQGAASVAAVRRFRLRFAGTPEADASRHAEVKLAARAADAERRVDAEQRFRAEYETWPEAREALTASRQREVALAASLGQASVRGEQDFREHYGEWPEAADAVQRSRSNEVSLALREARATGTLSALEAFRRDYARWPEAQAAIAITRDEVAALALRQARSDVAALGRVHREYAGAPAAREAGRLAVVLLLGPLEAEAPLEADAVLERLEAHGLLEPAREWAQSRDALLQAYAKRSRRAEAYRLYRSLRPAGPFAEEARRLEAEAAWTEASTSGSVQALYDFARRHGEHPRALDAERQALLLERQAGEGGGGPRAVVTGRRLLASGEVELTLDVVRCGTRVAGLRQENFELLVGSRQHPISSFVSLDDERPLSVAFALDLSGSMATEREAVQTAIRSFVETFRFRGRRTSVGLVTFSDSVGARLPPTPNAGAFAAWLARIPQAGGGAAEDSTGGLLAANELLKREPGEKVVILLTDEPLQLNVGGQRALARPMAGCAPVLRRLADFKRCGTPACRLQAFSGVSPRNAVLANLCARSIGASACGRLLDETAFADALQACGASGGVDAGSRALAQLRDALLKGGVRLHLVVPQELGKGDAFEELALALGGRIHHVDDESSDPATFQAPLMDIADQVSKQYVLRYRPGKDEASLPAQVLVRFEKTWTPWATMEGDLVEVVGLSGGAAECPVLVARARDGRLWRSSDCGRRFARWAVATPAGVEQLLPARGGGLWLLAGRRLSRVEEGGRVAAVESAVPEVHAVGRAADGRLWLIGRDARGAAAIQREGEGSLESVDLGLGDELPRVLFPAVGGGEPCVVLASGVRRCGGVDAVEAARVSASLVARLPDAPAVAWMLSSAAGAALFPLRDGALARTLDAGRTWREVLAASSPGWALAYSGALACAVSGEQGRCSEDAGLTWVAVLAGAQAAGGAKGTLAEAGGRLFLSQGGQLQQLAAVVNREAPSSAVYFDTNKATPTPMMRPFLAQQGRVLASNPQLLMRIEGHADQRGKDEHNDELSRRRAEGVAGEVVRAGAKAAQLTVAGFGSRRPIRTGGSPEELAHNRRVELLLLEPLKAAGDEAACREAERAPAPSVDTEDFWPGEEPDSE